ncbi:hypothetical protein [Pseudobacillus wudalianchiensis]|uniref:hypothetical protein n=1 Tax=Pseudobacillus wudalianchiensis TaxID=1743143 RepID=UPI00159F0511|nr:hypothetical protein [Bacillus wudalianchiensis]
MNKMKDALSMVVHVKIKEQPKRNEYLYELLHGKISLIKMFGGVVWLMKTVI